MNENANTVNWFEIPTTDIDRARKFYETIFSIEMSELDLGEFRMVTFPYRPESGAVSGALIQQEMYEPMRNGVLVYLNANPDIQRVIDRIEDAGGEVTIPRTQISEEIGFMAVFIDTEGNRLALHAQN
jgi:predicted enzyme related to lactoylglutathione lyase